MAETPLLLFRKRPEELTVDDILGAFQQLSPDQQEQFMLSYQVESRDPTSLEKLYVEDRLWKDSRDASGDKPASTAFCIVRSRFNHSCFPNAALPALEGALDDLGLSLYAWRNIAEGEELTFNYLNQFNGMCLTRAERQEELGFENECDCRACRLGTDFQRASDMRQRLIRGLLYLTRGVDVDDCWNEWLIEDMELRPDSSMFIYVYLAAFFIEEEGLMDDVVLATLSYHLRDLNLFSGSSNVGIAWLAAAQDT